MGRAISPKEKKPRRWVKYILGTVAVAGIFVSLAFVPKSAVAPSASPDTLPALASTGTSELTEASTQPYTPAGRLVFDKEVYTVTVGESATLNVNYIENKEQANSVTGNASGEQELGYERSEDINKEITADDPDNTKGVETETPFNEETTSNVKITWSTNSTDVISVDQNGKITAKAVGRATVYAHTSTGVFSSCVVTIKAPKAYTIENVPHIAQMPNYPSGCESISAVMFLNYYGYSITPETFIDDFLPQGYFDFDDGEMAGPDIASVFIGSPYSEDSLGCLPPVIEHAINEYIASLQKNKKVDEALKNKRAVDISGVSIEYLTENYIANNQPVLIWSTMYLWYPVVTYEWKVKGSAEYSPYNDGEICQWLANEHCLVLTGYDEDYYYFNDALYSQATISYERSAFDERYGQMGKGAIVLMDA